MAATTASAALAKASKADDLSKLPDSTKTKALEAAMAKADKMKDAAKAMATNASHAGMQLVHVGETQGTLALASFAEGAVHAKWGKPLKVGPVPVRAALGLLIGGWGMYDAVVEGKGTHQIAVAQGLIGSEVASLGIQAGAALVEKMAAKGQAQPAADAAASQGEAGNLVQLPPAVQGDTREIHAQESRAPVARLFDRAKRAA